MDGASHLDAQMSLRFPGSDIFTSVEVHTSEGKRCLTAASVMVVGFLIRKPFMGLFIDLRLTYNSYRIFKAGQGSVRELATREVGFDQSFGCRRS